MNFGDRAVINNILMADTAAARRAERIQEAVQRFTFEQFEPTVETFDCYLERFENKLAIIGIAVTDDEPAENASHRRNLLLTHVGREHYKLLVDHFQPDRPNVKSYTDIVAALKRHFGKTICVHTERRKFSMRFRNTNESVAQYIASLRALATDCQFRDLDERLRDQIFVGINEPVWLRELCSKFPDNTARFDDVERAVLQLEQASKQCQGLSTFGAMVTNRSNSTCYVTRAPQKGNNKSSQPKSTAAGSTTYSAGPHVSQPVQLDPVVHCLSCGFSRHKPHEQCPARGKRCAACKALNHFARVCIKMGNAVRVHDTRENNVSNRDRGPVRAVTIDDGQFSHSWGTEPVELDDGCYLGFNEVPVNWNANRIHAVNVSGKSAVLQVVINGVGIEMVYDPGAAFTILNTKLWQDLGKPALSPVLSSLQAYTHIPIATRGRVTVDVTAFGLQKQLNAIVVDADDVCLFGLDWCQAFDLKLPPGVMIRNISAECFNASAELNKLLAEYSDVFCDSELPGTLTGFEAAVHLKVGAQPRAYPARPVPLPLQAAVADELDRLVRMDILEPVEPTKTPIQWATPIVPVIKANGQVRVCGDFKLTLNKWVQTDNYPLPRFEDIVAKLNGSRVFSVIDLRDAYLQIPIAQEFRELFTIATHKGYFRYKRLPFGINFAPALFQRTMDKVLSGLPSTGAYLDDVACGSFDTRVHLQHLRAIFERLRGAGLRTQLSKCKFLEPRITYLGHVIDREGIHPTPEKIAALQNLRQPTNAKELRAFLGVINYYGKFVPNLQSHCIPLHQLVKKDVKWVWSREHEEVFSKLKQQLTSNDTLVHYDPGLPLILTTDASEVGLGVVLCHQFPDGRERPVAFASRVLSAAEKRYSVIEREALAIIFGVQKFQQYLLGRHFVLRTDHKPLEVIYGEHQALPKVAANRISRWQVILGTYDYEVQYLVGRDNVTADMLSRFPATDTERSLLEQAGEEMQILHLRFGDLPVNQKVLRSQVRTDPVLSKVVLYWQNGWPAKSSLPPELLTFFEKRDELSLDYGILLWKGRVVIPTSLRAAVLDMLHDGHPGVSAMRELARFTVYWPGLDEAVEKYVQNCSSCQEARAREPLVPLFAWNVPSEPWSRLHVDFAGPFEKHMWLVVVDAFSKWVEIKPMTTTTTEATVKVLHELFCRFGIPRSLVSDNGPQFASEEFAQFCKQLNITHIRSTPYHPRTNGLAERLVRTFKDRMRAAGQPSADIHVTLNKFLFSYRNTPQKATKRSPAELLFGRRLRSSLDMLIPDVRHTLSDAATRSKIQHDGHTRSREFLPGDRVWA